MVNIVWNLVHGEKSVSVKEPGGNVGMYNGVNSAFDD